MFETILVPVDVADAEFSEQILFHVLRLLQRESSKVELFSVIAPGGEDADERHISLRLSSARAHLQQLVDKMEGMTARANFDVQMGDPAQVILQRIQGSRPSLVAMATHGRTGPARWMRGSVAERVLRESESPLLLCTPPNDPGDDGSLEFRRILVPLDGSEAAAQILPLVSAFAEKHASTLVLCRVGYPAYAAVSGTTGGLPVLEKSDLEASLAPFVERLVLEGRTVETRVSFGDPASEILDTVDRAKVGLVAMTTHGHTGIDRWLFGSVAENVLRHCKTPLLVHRVKKVWISPEDVKG